MVQGAPFEFDLGSLPQRRVARARLLLGLPFKAVLNQSTALVVDPTAIVLDADRGEFVRVPDRPEGVVEVLALTADGSGLLWQGKHNRFGYRRLCLHSLATGEHRWLPVGPRQDDRFAAVSPDGRTVATLTGDDDVGYRDENDEGSMIVSLIDVDSGQRTPIWAASGGWSDESTISWSPGGQLIAFTYTAVLDHDDVDADVEWITVVLDLAGTVLATYERAHILPSANGAWLSEREIICDGDEGLEVHNFDDHSVRTLPPFDGSPVAVLDQKIIYSMVSPPDGPHIWVTAGLDGADRQPFLTMRPKDFIRPFDIAPLA